ncbi:MAG: cell wall metabolism sensor histidine kinase WalK [Leptolinea sp.]|jgi:two-component system phosphate regulon sensor histidine kinase PhoR|nr:cell wall metabolism sensor histidine kinase WalK [Leptolinea sp.]
MRYSLITRFALPYIALILAVMGGLSLVVSYSLRNSYTDNLKTRLLAETRGLAEDIANHLEAGLPEEKLEDIATTNAQLLDSRVTIIKSDGTVVGESQTTPAEMENHLQRAEVQSALKGTEATATRISSTLGKQYLYAAVPVNVNGQVVVVARLAIPLTEVESSVWTLNRAFLIAAGLVTGLAILLTVIISNWTTRPVRRLSSQILNLKRTPIQDSSLFEEKDEIHRLNQAFNSMSLQLQSQIDELTGERTKLAAVLNNMADGILIAGEDGIVQLINPAAERMFKTTANESLGKTLVEVVRHHQLVELWQRCKETGEPQTASYEISLEKIFVQAGATPMDSGMPGAVLLILQDLTRIRKLESLRREFVSNVSHELRTPLASMKALTETLREGAIDDPPAAQRFLGRMDIEIDTLTQMVEELLELSRIESGRVPLEHRLVLPGEMVDKAVDRMVLQAQRAGLTIEKSLEEDVPRVSVDFNRMVQVIVNLLHNAIKFTLPGGVITCGAYKSPEGVVFFVKDTGVGIDPESLPRIFERFYKADKARSGGGTGLGLSIARHLVEAHGGRIWAESQINEGTTVSFILPPAG